MTNEEFWDSYVKNDIENNYDIIFNFFSGEISDDFFEEYDAEEIVLETLSKLEQRKEFDKLLQFSEILKANHSSLYDELSYYFDEIFVRFYCFNRNDQKVEESFSSFIERPLLEYDIYLRSFKELLYFDHTSLANKAVNTNFEEIDNCDNLIQGAADELSECKLNTLLEQVYTQELEFNKSQIADEMSKFGYVMRDAWLSKVEPALLQDFSDEARESFCSNKSFNAPLISLGMHFRKYMFTKNFSFALSSKLWRSLTEFWLNRERKSNHVSTFFKTNADEFESYIAEKANTFLSDNKSEVVSILWGSVYAYEFLRSCDIINQESLESFVEISQRIKAKIIVAYHGKLWRFNFVHHWQKPESISEQEFISEGTIFEKSMSSHSEEFRDFMPEIREELESSGTLGRIIVQENRTLEVERSKREVAGSDGNPVVKEDKVGRNDPCPCNSGKKYKKCCGKA